METIYWIQRLGILNEIACIFMVLGIFVTIAMTVGRAIQVGRWTDDDAKKTWNNRVKTAFIVTVASMGVYLFVPSEKDLYVIYGVGGTIDYIKSNDTAKRLPDKVVNALDAWLDKQTEENNKDK